MYNLRSFKKLISFCFETTAIQYFLREIICVFINALFFLQLSVHPVEESQIQFIENHAFMHFKDQDSGSGSSQSQANRSIVTALYAEVIGVLAMTRFQSVRRRFVQEYKENQHSSRALVNIIMGLKFIRIKVNRLLGSDCNEKVIFKL